MAEQHPFTDKLIHELAALFHHGDDAHAAPAEHPHPGPHSRPQPHPPAQRAPHTKPLRRQPEAPPLHLAHDSARLHSGHPEAPHPQAPHERPHAPLTPEEARIASEKRLSFILAYLKDPAADPAFGDKRLVYKILAEEREYQQDQIGHLQHKLAQEIARALDSFPGSPEHQALEQEIAVTTQRQAQIFEIMKRLTGVHSSHTGGTGFLISHDEA